MNGPRRVCRSRKRSDALDFLKAQTSHASFRHGHSGAKTPGYEPRSSLAVPSRVRTPSARSIGGWRRPPARQPRRQGGRDARAPPPAAEPSTGGVNGSSTMHMHCACVVHALCIRISSTDQEVVQPGVGAPAAGRERRFCAPRSTRDHPLQGLRRPKNTGTAHRRAAGAATGSATRPACLDRRDSVFASGTGSAGIGSPTVCQPLAASAARRGYYLVGGDPVAVSPPCNPSDTWRHRAQRVRRETVCVLRGVQRGRQPRQGDDQ
jgi:hypothetical protein